MLSSQWRSLMLLQSIGSMEPSLIYPPMHVDASPSVIEPSASFKKSVINVTLSLLLFIGLYMVIFAMAILVAGVFVFAGGALIYAIHNLWVIIFGFGLIASGFMLLYFLVKFI